MKKINRFLLGRCTPQIQVQESVWGGRDFSFGDAVLCYILNIGVTVKHGIKCELSLELTHWLLSAGPHRCRKSAGSLSLLDHSACQQVLRSPLKLNAKLFIKNIKLVLKYSIVNVLKSNLYLTVFSCTTGLRKRKRFCKVLSLQYHELADRSREMTLSPFRCLFIMQSAGWGWGGDKARLTAVEKSKVTNLSVLLILRSS